MMRLARRFRKFLGLLSALLVTSNPCILIAKESDDRIILEEPSRIIIDQVRAAADAFADAYAQSSGRNRTLFDVLNADWIRRTESSISQLQASVAETNKFFGIDRNDSSFQKLLDEGKLGDLNSANYKRIRAGFCKYQLISTPIIFAAMTLLMSTDSSIGEGKYIVSSLFTPVFQLATYVFTHDIGLGDGFKNKITQKNWGEFRKEMRDVFFGRLSELGIPFDRKDPETWLEQKLDGNPALEWDQLSAREKKESAQKFRDYILSLSDMNPPDSPMRDELRNIAKSIDEHIPSRWWQTWRKGSVRKLSTVMGEAFARIRALDAEHQFAKDPALGEFYLDQRLLFDYPDLFTPETVNYLVNSRLRLSHQFLAVAPQLRELGAKIDLAHNKNSLIMPDLVQSDFSVEITFPEQTKMEAMRLDFSVRYKSPATDLRLAHQLHLPESNMIFTGELANAAISADLMFKITSAHEELFPEKNCASSLTKPALLPSLEALPVATP